MTPAETLAKSKQLDRFLGKAVTDIKTSDRAAMNKFAELAARSAALQKAADERADRLAERLDAVPDLLERAFAPHETKMDDLELGADALENSLHSMIGHNGAPLEVSPPAVPPSPPVTLPPVVEVLPPAIPMPVSIEPAQVEAPGRVVDLVPEPVVPPPVPLDPTATGNPPA